MLLSPNAMNRRAFLKSSAATGGALYLSQSAPAAAASSANQVGAVPNRPSSRPALPQLAPARWIWFPSGRTLQNTFVLFRRMIQLDAPPRRARGWISAESRYRLEVNGTRVQWGPPPADPRWPEADPIDLTAQLQPGANTVGIVVLFYGTGDGTWPIGKPGLLFYLEIEHADGRVEKVVSDASWKTVIDRAWPPGHYKRWYLRALQEEFDARLHPEGWSQPKFTETPEWLPALELAGSPQRPALSAGYYEYTWDVGGGPANAELRPRSIPLLREADVPVEKLAEHHTMVWQRTPQEYFEFRTPNAYVSAGPAEVTEPSPGEWEVRLDGVRGAALTFVWKEQVVGWPHFTLEAPAGTTVEMLVHEAHQLGGPPLLNTHFDAWTRFICREGINDFEPFDFESLRWLQLHLHGPAGRVRLRKLGIRRRQFPWPQEPLMRCGEPALQRLFDASINTLHNCAQETLVDGMARERQQYSGDGGHQLHAVHLAFGETRLPARYLTTFSQGLTKDGFFLDCWPAFDRLARLVERQLDLSGWGPILDHGVGFNFDCWHHWQYTGDLQALAEPYPRLVRFAQYLAGLVGSDGLLPVENLGIPSVWIDHVAYQKQRHKQCAFNLYAAAMLQHALAPLCRAWGDTAQAQSFAALGRQMQSAVVRRFWSRTHGVFVNNLPWLTEEKQMRTCDRSLATAVLFDQCPGGQTAPAVQALADCPSHLGFSYPCNAGWRLWALAKGGRADIVVNDLRTRWAPMESVLQNNTLQEDWEAHTDAGQQWSHCAVVPLYLAHHGLMGLRPLQPGFAALELRPQFGDLSSLDIVAHTVRGPVRLTLQGARGNRHVRLEVPAVGRAELLLPAGESVALPPARGAAPAGLRRYLLPPGQATSLHLRLA